MSNASDYLRNIRTSDLIDALFEHEDVIAFKVWTRQDCEDVARQLIESRTPDGEVPEERLKKVVDGMMANRNCCILDELKDCKDSEWDALWELASDNDPDGDELDAQI